MVDGIVAPGADGTETWAPRPPEEMETLRQLVQSAIGFDAARGDTVTIESLQFTLPPEQGSLVERGGPASSPPTARGSRSSACSGRSCWR